MIQLLGQTISETIDVFRPAHAGSRRTARKIDPGDKTRAMMRLIVSLAILAIGGFLCTRNDSSSVSAGVGLLGIVAGYWIR
jgi:hypothetical protein